MMMTNLVLCVVGTLGLVVIGLSRGLFQKSYRYVGSETITTTADGKTTVDREYAEVRSGLKLDWSDGGTLSYTTVELVPSNGIDLPSVSQRTWRLGL
jgi:hypothetical protein